MFENKFKVFISSVFTDNIREEQWSFRKHLKNLLSRFGYQPWLYEDEISIKIEDISTIEGKITAAIKNCDCVMAFFKTRAGGTFNDLNKGTVYEINEALRLRKRLWLFVIGDYHSSSLKQILAIYNHDEIVRFRIQCKNEEQAMEIALNKLAQMIAQRLNIVEMPSELSSYSKDYYEALERQVRNKLIIHDYQSGAELFHANPLPQSHHLLKSNESHFLALCYSRMASVLVNIANYDQAEIYSRRAIGLFLQMGNMYEVYAEIERLSGILSMAGKYSAVYTNFYGFHSTEKFTGLALGYQDSRISIFTKLGLYKQGLQFIKKDLFTDNNPYYATRYYSMFGRSGIRGAMNQARKAMDEFVSLSSNDFQAYVLFEAGKLALDDRDYSTAKKLFNNAQKYSIRTGSLHTEREITSLIERINKTEH